MKFQLKIREIFSFAKNGMHFFSSLFFSLKNGNLHKILIERKFIKLRKFMKF